MIGKASPLAHGEIDVLILQALVRKLIMKGVLSPDDVRALLFDAATRLDLVGSDLTPEAARVIVEEDLALRSWELTWSKAIEPQGMDWSEQGET